MANDDNSETEISVEIPIKRVFPPGHSPKFANHFVLVRPSEHEVHFLAFCLRPPIMNMSANREEVSQLEFIEAECVSEIIFPSGRLHELKTLFCSLTMPAEKSSPAVAEG